MALRIFGVLNEFMDVLKANIGKPINLPILGAFMKASHDIFMILAENEDL